MKIIIIGGSHAGIACAKRAREEFPESEIIIYEKKEEVSFISQSIPQYLMGKNNLTNHSTYMSVEELEAMGVQVKINTNVEEIDTANKSLTYISELTEETGTDTYDKLVLATGSYPIIPPIFGSNSANLFFVKQKEDAFAISDFVEQHQNIAVLGGGMIGVELARIFHQKGLNVNLIQAGTRLLNKYLDQEVSKEVEALLTSEGIKIHTSTLALGVETVHLQEDKEQMSIYTETETVSTDGALVAIGFRPNSYLLRDQVELGDMGAIEVDEYMRTSLPDVFAVGDCATTLVRHRKHRLYLPHASDAFREGAVAAINLVEPTASQGTYTMNLDNYSICVSGLTKEFALLEDFDAEIVSIENHFLNSDDNVKMWLVYDKTDHKILGIQVMGSAPNLSSYANMISVAMQAEMTVEDLEFADLYFEHGYKNPDGFMKTFAQKVREQSKNSGG